MTNTSEADSALDYRPYPTTARFHSSAAFVRALMGPFGSGKSSACIHELTAIAEDQQPSRRDGIRRTRFAVIRNTFPELKDTTIKTWMLWFPEPKWGTFKWTPHPDYLMRWRHWDGKTWVECEINFRALDQPKHTRNLKSWDITGYWINEASEISKPVKDALDARCGRYPDPRDVAATWRGGILDTNPPDTDHWWYRLFEEERPPNHEIFKQPSGLSDEAENLEFLPGWCEEHLRLRELAESRGEEYVKPRCRICGRIYYETFSYGKSREFIDVFVHGKYGFVFDGKPVYKDVYFPALHDSPTRLNPVPGIQITEGWDWGLTPATIWFQVLPGPRVNFLRELCSTNMGADQHADDVLAFRRAAFPDVPARLFSGYADPAGWSAAQTDQRTCVDICSAKGIRLQQGAVDFAARYEAMAHIFKRLHDGRGAVQIDPRCTVFKKALLGGYHFRRIERPGQEVYHEKPDKNHPYSDIANAAEYPVSKLFNVPTVTRMEIAANEEATRVRWREVRGTGSGPAPRSWATK